MFETTRNMKERWDAIRIIINRNKKKHINCPINHSILGKHFSTIADKLNSKLPNVECEVLKSNENIEENLNFSFETADPYKIYNTITNLNSNKGPGPDDITAKILKNDSYDYCTPSFDFV